MDKNKAPIKRGPNKVKATLFPPGDFIALGTKSTRPSSEAMTAEQVKMQAVPVSSVVERKWEVSSSLPASSKKAKLSASGSSLTRSSGSKVSSSAKSEQWDSMAIEVEAGDLLSKVLDSEEHGEDSKVEAFLCGAVKTLKQSRAKPDQALVLSILYLAKTRPAYFSAKPVTEAFCNLLKRDGTVNFKTKGNNLVSVLAANVLMSAYIDETRWPESFIKVYLEDSLGDRVWVDHEDCKGFVDNIQTAFNTTLPPRTMPGLFDRKPTDAACSSPPTFVSEEDEASSSSISYEPKENVDNISIFSRYGNGGDSVESSVVDAVGDQLARRGPAVEVSRNMLRLLIATAGLAEIRLLVAQRLELWLHNPKLTKPAQDLLLGVCMNCNKHNQIDVEVISHLIKIRIKKPLLNHFLHCIKELLGRHPDNLSTVLHNAIYNELSNSRNPNNMQLLSVIFQHAPEKAAKVLAEVFRELLSRKEDYLRSLRSLLREVVRSLRYDLNLGAFCLGLLSTESTKDIFRDLEPPIKERYFFAIADLIVLAIFLGISPAVKEAATAYARGDKKDIVTIRNYQNLVANIQRDAVWWFHTVVPKMFPKLAPNDFIHCLHKVLFMEQAEHYYNKDNWPPESERGLMLRLAAEVPVLEDALLRVLLMGLTREHPISAPDSLDLGDQLIKRAANIFLDETPVLVVEKMDIIDAVFNLCAYHHPDHITLPQGYQPPKLAIIDLYWKAWIMLLVVVAHNPSTYGQTVWETYPTLKCLMEMCITNSFIFPPPTVATGEKADEMRNQELQMAQQEKEEILEFETHLAASSLKVAITEANSHLISKLMTMEPCGMLRKPPQSFMDQLKVLNQTHRIGHLLCSSRNPDFLLDIIQRQGTTQSMPWLAELVESSEGTFNMLPVQCLCEFLLNETLPPSDNTITALHDAELRNKKKKKQEQLLRHLQDVVHNPGEDFRPTYEVLDYFMRRLSSHQPAARASAAKGLGMVLANGEGMEIIEDTSRDDYQRLLHYLPRLPHFDAVKASASHALRQACHVESNPNAVLSYVLFLAMFTPDENHQDFADLALDMAQMIVERSTILNVILPPDATSLNPQSTYFLTALLDIFLRYLHSAKRPLSKETYAWADTQDHILVQWSNGEAATLHIVVVHAMVILLTFGPPPPSSLQDDLSGQQLFEQLLETWFPRLGDPPQAYLVDTSEEALLLPDWLKLRMIRSSVPILVDAALKDLDASQLVLFIQSFGIPVSSMSKLLCALDEAVLQDSEAVEQSVVDKAYMAQLVEVQHHRGARGGMRFAQLLLHHSAPNSSHLDLELEDECTGVQTSVIQQGPPRPPTAATHPKEFLSSVLNLFCFNGKLPPRKQQELYQGLHKALLQDCIAKNGGHLYTSEFIVACIQVLQSEKSIEFVKSLHEKFRYSIVLFRLCITNNLLQSLVGKLLWLLNKILHLSGEEMRSPLTSLCQEFIARHSGSKVAAVIPAWRQFLQAVVATQPHLTRELFLEVVSKVRSEEPVKLEEAVSKLVALGVERGDTACIIEAMVHLLIESTLQQAQNARSVAEVSLYIDWLEKLEPKLINTITPLQQKLIFDPQPPGPYRPYLLAWLVHQTGWDTLDDCLFKLLLNPLRLQCHPGAALDFLILVLQPHLPRPNETAHVARLGSSAPQPSWKSAYKLSPEQSQIIVDYILQEAHSLQSKSDKDSLKLQETIELRLPLLLRCQNPQLTAKYLIKKISSDEEYKDIAQKLLLYLYMKVPRLLSDIPAEFIVSDPILLEGQSKLDVVSHSLISALAKAASLGIASDKLPDLEVACRKLAATHPLLFLRQLPMVAALLRGRTASRDSPAGDFRSRPPLVALFSAILSILELLVPHLFGTESCPDVMVCYLEFFNAYLTQTAAMPRGTQGEYFSLVHRWLELLQDYLESPEHSSKAIDFVTKNLSQFQELAGSHPELSKLKCLLANPTATTDLSFFKAEWSPSQLAPLSRRLTSVDKENFDDVLCGLQDLESLSNRKPSILNQFLDELKQLIQSEHTMCRLTATKLLLRLLRNNPKLSEKCVSAILQCLENENRDVMLTTLDHLPEYVVLCQEHTKTLLQKAFSIGIHKNIPSSSQISDSFNLLTIHSF